MEEKSNVKNIVIVFLIVCLLSLGAYTLISKSNNNKEETICDECDTTELESKINDLESQVKSLNKEKETLNSQIESLNSQITTLTNDKNTLDSKITSLNSTIKSNNSKISSLEKLITNNKKTINDLENDKEILNNKLISLNNEKDTLNSQIENLNTQIDSLKSELKSEKETFTVFYSVNNKTIYQERVKKGEDVKNVPSSPIEDTTVTWSNDGKNIQSDTVIYGTVYCTLTFDSATDQNGEVYAFLSTDSYVVPYGTVIEFSNYNIKVGEDVIVYSYFNTQSDGVEDSYTGWYVYDEDGTYTVKNSGTLKITESEYFSAYYGGCVLKGTKITMADGSTKKVEDLITGEEILSYNFYNGNMEAKKVIGIMKGTTDTSNIISINMENGNTLKIVDLEYVFDADDKKYYLVNPNTYKNLVGKNLLVNNNGNKELSKVSSVSLSKEATENYTLFIEHSSNYIADGIITRSYTYWLNDYYTFNDDLQIDQIQLEKDIQEYGLYTYDEVKDYVSYEIFESMNLKYAKFIEGKGIASHEYVLESLSMLEYEIKYANKRFNK